MILDELRRLVDFDSPSSDPVACRATAHALAAIAVNHVRTPAEWRDVGGRTQLLWTHGGIDVLLLGHLDTVWPVGTVAYRPFSFDGRMATGAGVYDMKSGLLIASMRSPASQIRRAWRCL